MNNNIDNINAVFAPYGLVVNDVIKTSQTIRYKLNLPLDVKLQGKLRRAAQDIECTLTTALHSNDISLVKDADALYVECKSDFEIVPFHDYIDNVLSNSGLQLVLGQNTNGQKIITDLSKAPHILVGGTTGSGKSELLHSFIASLAYDMKKMPIELLIIDPKRAEYSAYKNCKNIKVITEMDEAVEYLHEAVKQMEYRYYELESNGAKDIYRYTGLMDMHPIVIIIDELADLMLSHKEIEKDIVRIAQKARACGIHLIIGTQTPRANIITGQIKANIPTKIALKTVNSLESRIILDRNGADKLCGKGDMLFLANGAFEPIRIQSAYVDDNDKNVIASMLAKATVQTNSNDNCNEKSNYFSNLLSKLFNKKVKG